MALVRKARGDYHGDRPLPRQGGPTERKVGMIIVTGAVRFGNGEIERLRSALVRNVETSRKEGGCEAYSYAVDLLEPNLLRITEMWHDDAALDAHTRKLAELMAPLEGAKIEQMSVTAYQATFLRNVVGD